MSCVNPDDPINGPRVCCSSICEQLGIGTPIYSLIDPYNAARGGINITYTSIATNPGDVNLCPYDPNIGTNGGRSVVFMMQCKTTLGPDPQIVQAYEESLCKYVIQILTQHACGCAPNCPSGALCGGDGCGGFCSGQALNGNCPTGQVCMEDQSCCRPDCNNRDCGDDGCGGSCGVCGSDETCSSVQVCVENGSYNPQYQASYYVNTGGIAGAYIGGIIATVVAIVFVGVYFFNGKERFEKWRSGEATSSGLLAKSASSRPASGFTTATTSSGGGFAAAAKASSYGST
jgi:hypothetical protein